MIHVPYFFVERYDAKNDKWVVRAPLVWNSNNTKRIEANLYPYYRDYELFNILEGKKDPKMYGVHLGLPKCCDEEIVKIYEGEKDFDKDGNEIKPLFDYKPKVYWFTYADMRIYLLENPEVLDYEADQKENKQYLPNPVFRLQNRVDAFLEVCDGWKWRNDYSLIRIIFWID